MRRTTTAAILFLLAPLLAHCAPAHSIIPKPASHHKTTTSVHAEPTKPPSYGDDYELVDLNDLPPTKYHFPTVAVQIHEDDPHTHYGPSDLVHVYRKDGKGTVATLLAYDLKDTKTTSGGPHVSSTDKGPGGNTKHKYLCKIAFLEPLISNNLENVPFIEVYLMEKGFNPKKTGWYNSPEAVRMVGRVDVEMAVATQIGDENEPGFGGWPCDPKGKLYLGVAPFTTGDPDEDAFNNIDIQWKLSNLKGLVVYVEEQFLDD